MKIVLIGLTWPFRGGISHFTTTLHRHLAEKHQVCLISFSRLYPAFLFPGKTQYDSSNHSFAAKVSATLDSLNPVTWLTAMNTIRKFQPDQVIFTWWSPVAAFCYSALARLCKLFKTGKLIFYCHNVYPHERHAAGELLTRLTLGTADLFLTNSGENQKMLERLFPDIPAVKAFHPLYDIFPKSGISQTDARNKFALKGNVLLFFGYIREYKGLAVLIRAMSHVLKKMDCRLVVAGEFYEPKEKYDQLIATEGLEGKIIFHDRYIPNEEVEPYFAATDALVLPYTNASQSGVVQVAYHFNKPVISTRVGGLAEVIEHGQTGYVVPANDPQALANAIVEFYANKETVAFSQNIESIKSRFSWSALVQLIEHLGVGA